MQVQANNSVRAVDVIAASLSDVAARRWRRANWRQFRPLAEALSHHAAPGTLAGLAQGPSSVFPGLEAEGAVGMPTLPSSWFSWADVMLQTIGIESSPSLPSRPVASPIGPLPSTAAGVPIATGLTPEQEAEVLRTWSPEKLSLAEAYKAAGVSQERAYAEKVAGSGDKEPAPTAGIPWWVWAVIAAIGMLVLSQAMGGRR